MNQVSKYFAVFYFKNYILAGVPGYIIPASGPRVKSLDTTAAEELCVQLGGNIATYENLAWTMAVHKLVLFMLSCNLKSQPH